MRIREIAEELLAYSKQLVAELSGQEKKYKKFVIVCGIRTGSTMLTKYLNSHPQIKCFFEIFHRHQTSIPFGVKGYQLRSNQKKIVQLHIENPVEFTTRYIFGQHPAKIKAVGFKLLYTQGRNSAMWWNGPEFEKWWSVVSPPPLWGVGKTSLWDYLAQENVSIIHLTRDNILERRVSSYVALQTGKWGIGASGGISENRFDGVFSIDPEDLLLDVKSDELNQAEIKERFANNPLIETTYESLTENPEKELSRILEFLGVDNITLSTPTRKQANYSLKEIITNYAELKERFIGTPQEKFFNE